jgi:hypothetical protein
MRVLPKRPVSSIPTPPDCVGGVGRRTVSEQWEWTPISGTEVRWPVLGPPYSAPLVSVRFPFFASGTTCRHDYTRTRPRLLPLPLG